ncbi:MAG: AAA family ATPase, partial [bacterium]|nr:AAA family ATPase [bacterium]
ATLQRVSPKLLLLDPLVRLHRLNENKAQEMSGLLGFLTELQRAHQVAVVVVHHTSKKSRSRPGQSLRGSSDLHAWGASNAYITEQRGERMLTLEHRAAPSPEPMRIELVSKPDGSDAHLRVVGGPTVAPATLATRIVDLLQTAPGPLRRASLRAQLRVNNNRLGEALVALESAARVQRTAEGWVLPLQPSEGQQGLFGV